MELHHRTGGNDERVQVVKVISFRALNGDGDGDGDQVCTFTGNFAFGGGGILDRGNSTATVTGCTFTGNSAFNGGGLDNVNNGGMATVTGCTFTSNSGGGLNNNGTETVTGCTFTSNSGGGLNNNGTATASGCTFTSNSGGGLNNNGTATVSGCTFTSNSATSGGGLNNGGTMTITDSTLSGNPPPATAVASPIAASWQSPGSTLSDNSAVEEGGGIFNDGGGLCSPASPSAATPPRVGGGLFNTNGGVLAIVVSDISGNGGRRSRGPDLRPRADQHRDPRRVERGDPPPSGVGSPDAMLLFPTAPPRACPGAPRHQPRP